MRFDRFQTAGRLVILALLLMGCSVENLDGVPLVAPVIVPTSTAQPTSTPNPLAMELPNAIEKEFMGTLLAFRYPEGWTTDEGGQYLNVYSTNPATPAGLGIFISLTRSVGLDSDSDEALAPLAMQAFLQNAADHGFANPDSVPGEGEARPFEWGNHDAALFQWQSGDGSTTGLQVVLMDSRRDRFVLFSMQAAAEQWTSMEPTFKAILASVTLDGDALPAEGVLAAYDAR